MGNSDKNGMRGRRARLAGPLLLIPAMALFAVSTTAPAAEPQVYPNKPIRFVLPYAPGGATSVSARILSQKLAEAARTIGEVPGALELRRLQTLSEIGVEHNSTIIAMFPVELLEAAQKIAGKLGN